MSKMKYYSLDKILKENADYNIIYGERSNGKTTAVLYYGLKDYVESGYINQLAIVRRWEEDYKGKNGSQMFEGIVSLGWVKELTNNAYNNITYFGQRWFLSKYSDEGKKEYQDEKPFALGFSITSEEHYKSTSYPNIKTVLFDEFITRSYYIPNEFIKFQNLLSTIIRLRDDVKIFMCGNTINQYCPYFAEMGLRGVRKQKQGTIDVYLYGETDLKVAVEYTEDGSKGKKSNKYFAFDNPKLKMIKTGSWEIDIYPHLPVKYIQSDIKYQYYIYFNEQLLQCEIIRCKELKKYITFIHRKTTPIKEEDNGLRFQEEVNADKRYRRKINIPFDTLGKKLWQFFVQDNVYYQDNEVGEVIRNYIIWCKKEGI